MITITSEYLNENWGIFATNSILPITLSVWDEGDVYTLSSLGSIPSQKVALAAIVLGEKKVTDFPIVVRLHKLSDTTKTFNYQSPEGDRYNVSAERSSSGVIESMEIKVVGLIKDLALRRNGLIETDLLKDSSVLIIGLGTGGIQIALELAKSGVGKFKLIDPDRLEAGNVGRHHAGISFVGRKKVNVAKDLILDKNPFAQVETFPVFASEENKEMLIPIIENIDLIICANDNRQNKLFINSLCLAVKKPAIFAGAFRRAYGGQILRVRPGESACYHCFVLAMPEREVDQEISSEENAQEIAYSDMPVSVEPGLSMDVAPIGIMASKLALQELIKGKESTLHILDKDFEANWYFWINRPEPKTDYASLPPLSESGPLSKNGNDMTILRWYGVYLEKDQGCPTCGDFSKVLREQYSLDSGAIKPPGYSVPPSEIKE